MVCQELLLEASAHQKKNKIKCPIRIFPKCHPKAYVDCFVDGKLKIITLVCSACDQTIATIQVKGKLSGKIQR